MSLPKFEELKINCECSICYSDIEENTRVFIEHKGEWKMFEICLDCVENSRKTFFKLLIDSIKSIDCEKSLMSVLSNFNEIKKNLTHNFIYSGKEIDNFYYNGQIQSAKFDCPFDEDTYNNIIVDLYKVYLNFTESGKISNYLEEINDIIQKYDL